MAAQTAGHRRGAVIALTKALAREFAKTGIRINAVAPSRTMTDLVRRQLEVLDPPTLDRDPDRPGRAARRGRQDHCIHHLGQPIIHRRAGL
jgi:NAD(P)-dependent dehydrogenase (short-subunit alcohol dehydrogenase family)